MALDRLTDMLLICTEIKEYYVAQSNGKAEQFWNKREQTVLHALIDCALSVIYIHLFILSIDLI